MTGMEGATMRQLNGKLIGLVLKATGCPFRFSKEYRWGVTRWHRMVYACVNTIEANWTAGMEI